MRWNHVVGLGWATLAVCVAAGTAQEPRRAAELEQAAKLLAQARPHLEAVLGAPLTELPRLRLATAAELQDWDRDELEAQVRRQFPDLAGDGLSQSVAATSEACRRSAVVRYRADADAILLLPDNLAPVAAWDDTLRAVDSPAFVQLALVHETVRWRLDHRHGLARLRAGCPDQEAFRCLQAAVEGRGQWVTRDVARRLGTEACFPLLARVFLHVPDATPDPALRVVSQEVLRQRYWAYAQGLAFWSALEVAGVKDAEGRVFGRLPCQVSWIDRPELYLRAARTGRPELDTALAALEGPGPAADWTVARQPWTPDMVRQVADLFGERTRADQVVRSWEDARLALWSAKGNPGQQVAVSAVRFDSAPAARSYYGFATDLQRKQDERLGDGRGGVRVAGSRSRALAIPAVDEAVYTEKQLQFGAGLGPMPLTVLTARSGPVVIEITWRGRAGDTAWAERVIRKITSE
jgi:hypothetical protein